jgi:AcrR family transcriptional regulator
MAGITERSDARLNRERILEAAFDVITEKGISAEVKEIADRAGVGIGTIYRNFPTKDDLVVAILSDMLDATERVLDTAVETRDPADAMAAYVRGIFSVLPRFTPIMMAMLSGSVAPSLKERLMDLMLDERLAHILERGRASGTFRADLNIDIARAFVVNTFHPMVYLALQGKMDVPAMADGYVDLVLRALRA